MSTPPSASPLLFGLVRSVDTRIARLALEEKGVEPGRLPALTGLLSMKLYAIRIFVRKWDGACEFFRDKLELPERLRDDGAGWAEYDLDGPCFGLQRVDEDDTEGEDLVGRFVGASLHVEDTDTSYRDLQARGVHFTAPPEKQPGGGSLAFFEDPDGNVITLLG